MSSLELQIQNYRAVGKNGSRFLLHVPTTAMYELDQAADSVLALLEETGSVSEQDVRGRFDGLFSPDEVCDSISDFMALGVISPEKKDFKNAQSEWI